jgi:transcriptional regulator with XRE-family HTH domain
METIGSKISKIRKQKGMSQEELSDLSKINLRTLQRIEKNENHPSGNTLRLICETLQINIEEILNYGKIEDNNYLMFLHLSIISNVIIPLGNIIFPLILWLNKRESIINVDKQGKNILNFQIKKDSTLNSFINEYKLDIFNDNQIDLRISALKIALFRTIDFECERIISSINSSNISIFGEDMSSGTNLAASLLFD